MEFWQAQVGDRLQPLQRLERHAVIALLQRCIQHAFEVNAERFRSEVDPVPLRLIEAALDDLRQVAQSGMLTPETQRIHEELGAMPPLSELTGDFALGFDSIRSAIICSIGYLDALEQYREGCATDAIWYAYESISLHAVNDIILRTGARLSEQGVTLLEAEVPVCQREIAFQLECLRLVQI